MISQGQFIRLKKGTRLSSKILKKILTGKETNIMRKCSIVESTDLGRNSKRRVSQMTKIGKRRSMLKETMPRYAILINLIPFIERNCLPYKQDSLSRAQYSKVDAG
jgi:hypothetical protein